MSKLTAFFFVGILLFTAACGPTDTETAQQTRTPGQIGSNQDMANGQAIFRQKCVVCHGADGKLGLNGAKDLGQSTLILEERVQIITNGKKLMTPFNTVLSPEEIRAVAEYTLSLKK